VRGRGGCISGKYFRTLWLGRHSAPKLILSQIVDTRAASVSLGEFLRANL